MVLEMSWKRKRSRQQQRYQQEEVGRPVWNTSLPRHYDTRTPVLTWLGRHKNKSVVGRGDKPIPWLWSVETAVSMLSYTFMAQHKLKLAKDVRKYKEADQDSAKNTAQQLKHIRKQHMKMLKMLARENRDWRQVLSCHVVLRHTHALRQQHVIKVKRKAVQRRMKGKEKEAKAAVEARHKAVAQTTYRRQAEVLQKRGDELRAKREQSAKSRERVLKRQASEQHKKTMESRVRWEGAHHRVVTN